MVNTIFDGSGVPSGKLDLRGAVDLADALPGSNTVTFDPTVFAAAQSITLAAGQLELFNLGGTPTITGPAKGVTVSGGGLNRVVQVDSGVTATLSGLTITAGAGTADRGGGLLNFGNLTLMSCTVSGNTASTNGGGLANYGMATLRAPPSAAIRRSQAATTMAAGSLPAAGPSTSPTARSPRTPRALPGAASTPRGP